MSDKTHWTEKFIDDAGWGCYKSAVAEEKFTILCLTISDIMTPVNARGIFTGVLISP